MAIGKDGAVRRQLRTLFNVGAARELTDGQLLERFATEGGESAELAFAVLVERHGAMVLRVCRGVLSDAHAAQDAFQATFLVLVKRARGLWVRDSIGPWLHQVAYRTAACARATSARHRRLERDAAITAQQASTQRDFELERLLHEEIDRLPERYRSPVVLCDLEGRTHEQVARHLGWPVGTVKSRLSRGRERLRDRLIRRGLAPGMSPLAVAGLFKAPTLSLAPDLLEATTTAAVRYALAEPVVRGSAVTLAEGVMRTMTMTQWWKVAAVLLVAGATASGVEWLGDGAGPVPQAATGRTDRPAIAGDTPTREVKSGKLEFRATARGTVEAARISDLMCNIAGRTTIIKIVPEGSRVRKGDVVVELDSASLRDQLVNQRNAINGAEDAYKRARLAREVAEIALHEYREGVFKQQEQAVRQEVDAARDATRKAEGRLQRTRRANLRIAAAMAAADGSETAADLLAELDIRDRLEEAERSLERERRALAQAEARRDVLENVTRVKTVKELEAEIGHARADELAKEKAWELEKRKAERLDRQIADCTLKAPINGKVLYANDPARITRNAPPTIEEGATVREHQIIVRLFDPDGPMQINLKVPEAMVSEVAPKMKARVKVDAFPDATLDGEVAEVAPLPDPNNLFSRDIKVYTTRIRLDAKRPPLVPGFTASAAILLDERENAIGVPVGAVVRYDDKDHVAVKVPDGPVEWREVTLGTSDGSITEVKEGLRDGERVILEPRAFLSDEQRVKVKTPTETAPKKAESPTKARRKPARPPR